MATIGNILAKGQEVIGAAEGIRSALPPGIVPAPLSNALDKLLGKTNPGASSPTSKSLNDFRSNFIYKRSILRNNRFYVQINPPGSLFKGSAKVSGTSQEIKFVAESASLPGVQLMTTEVRRAGIGPFEKKPYNAAFVDVTMNFIIDGGGLIYDFFYQWMNGIIKFNRGVTELKAGETLSPYEVEYKENYQTDIDIFVLDELNRVVIQTTLYNAFPIFVGDVPLSWNNSNDFVRIPVTFTYTHWSSDRIELVDPKSANPKMSALQKILAVGSALQTLAAIKKPTGVGDIISIVGTGATTIGQVTNILKN